MLKRIVLPLTATLLVFYCTSAHALEMKKGTISLGGSSNMTAGRSDTDRTASADEISISINSGYFFIDNIEIGGLLTTSYLSSDETDIKSFSISPFVTYHIDLNETSNFYLSGMFGYSKSYYDDNNFSDDSDGTSLSAEIGWEYFFTPFISGTIGIKYTRSEYDLMGNNQNTDNSVTSTFLGTNIGLKVYF